MTPLVRRFFIALSCMGAALALLNAATGGSITIAVLWVALASLWALLHLAMLDNEALRLEAQHLVDAVKQVHRVSRKWDQ